VYQHKIGPQKNTDTDLTYLNSPYGQTQMRLDLKNEIMSLGHHNWTDLQIRLQFNIRSRFGILTADDGMAKFSPWKKFQV